MKENFMTAAKKVAEEIYPTVKDDSKIFVVCLHTTDPEGTRTRCSMFAMALSAEISGKVGRPVYVEYFQADDDNEDGTISFGYQRGNCHCKSEAEHDEKVDKSPLKTITKEDIQEINTIDDFFKACGKLKGGTA